MTGLFHTRPLRLTGNTNEPPRALLVSAKGGMYAEGEVNLRLLNRAEAV